MTQTRPDNSISNIDDQTPPPFVVEYVKKASPRERYVRWLRNWQGSRLTGFFKGLFSIAQGAALCLSIIGIPTFVRSLAEWHVQNSEDDFQLSLAGKESPDVNEIIDLPSKTRVFNHIDEFAIENDVIWFRKRSSQDEWKAIYFDGYPDQKPKEIDVDGANLIVIDDKGQVHYKKILKEYRASEMEKVTNQHFNELTKNQINQLPDTAYVAVDKSDLNNWKSKWFSLPLVSMIVNLFQGKRLKIDDGARSVVISHRGRFNDYIEDAAGKKHPVSTGVTTLYVLDKEGKSIHKYDPWSPKSADVCMYFPETSYSAYNAIKITASSSTIMAIGYNVDLLSRTKSLKIITKLGDIDTEGWNPALKYSHSKSNEKRNIRILPIGANEDGKEWKEHPLPVGSRVTNVITIRQTGKGNLARELRVEGMTKHGEWGYFHKNIADDSWLFEQTQVVVSHDDRVRLLPVLSVLKNNESETTTVHNYNNSKGPLNSIELKEFGEHSYHSMITFTNEGKEYNFHLNKKHGLASFLGKKTFKYEIVIPDEMLDDPFVKKTFPLTHLKNGKIKVHVKERKNEVVISAHGMELSMKMNSYHDLSQLAKRFPDDLSENHIHRIKKHQ